MRWWAGFAGVLVASMELFVACSNDSTPMNDAQAPMDGTTADTTVDTGKPDAAMDADAMQSSDARDASTLDAMDASCDASASDPRNCGRCGHDCVGGACEGGVCQPWTILSTPASDITSDDSQVYWVLGASPGNVSKCDRTGCDAGTPLVPNVVSPGKIALDTTRAYFTTYVSGAGFLGACAKGGCDGGATVLSGNQTYPAWVVVDSTNAYWNVFNGDIFACALPGCPDGGASITTMSVGQGLAQDSTNLFWSEGYQYLYSCQKSSCNNTRKMIVSGQTPLRSVAAYGGNVYAIQSGANGKIIRCPNQTNCNPTVMAQNLDDGEDIEVDATGIYFVLHGTNPATNGSLAYCPIGGCMGTPQTLIGNLSYSNAVGIDKDAVYVASSGSPILGIAKP